MGKWYLEAKRRPNDHTIILPGKYLCGPISQDNFTKKSPPPGFLTMKHSSLLEHDR